MLRLLAVDDHPLIRDGIKHAFQMQWGEFVFGEAASAAEALQRTAEQEWDVILLERKLGVEVLKQIKLMRPQVPVLMLSSSISQQYANQAFRAGAAGYFTKDSPRSEFLSAVETLLRGGRYASSNVTEKMLASLGRHATREPHDTLSAREFEVMFLLAGGRSITEIATSLSLSSKTVSTYRARILAKLGLSSSAALVRYVIDSKLAE